MYNNMQQGFYPNQMGNGVQQGYGMEGYNAYPNQMGDGLQQGYYNGSTQTMGVGYNAGGYPQQTPTGMGRIDSYGAIRYSKAEILQCLRDYIFKQTGMAVSREQKLEEEPDLLHHACAEAGVSFLGKCMFHVYDMNIAVPYYFCKACGKFYYYKDFYI